MTAQVSPMRGRPARARVRQCGLSLVELMVALLIGALLTLAVVRIFVGARASYTVTEDLSRIQENARFAITARLISFSSSRVGKLGLKPSVSRW